MRTEFVVYGRPQPAGSKRAFKHAKTGQVLVRDMNDKAAPWKQQVAGAAREAVGIRHELLPGPLVLEAIFVLARPKGHFGTGRNAGIVKTSSPPYPVTQPDTTKLVRCLEDALTGVLWRDDSQIVTQYAWKEYGEPERCEVTVRTLDTEAAGERTA